MKRFYRYVSGKRKATKEVGPLHKETGDMVTQDKEKAEVLYDYFSFAPD